MSNKKDYDEIKKKIFVYHMKDTDSHGIYLGETKEEAYKDALKELFGHIYTEEYIQNHKENLLTMWSWDEYKKQGGFDVAERLLEITC